MAGGLLFSSAPAQAQTTLDAFDLPASPGQTINQSAVGNSLFSSATLLPSGFNRQFQVQKISGPGDVITRVNFSNSSRLSYSSDDNTVGRTRLEYNHTGLGADLTSAGNADRFKFLAGSDLGTFLDIKLTSALGTATKTVNVAFLTVNAPMVYQTLFNSFTTGGTFDITAVTKIEIEARNDAQASMDFNFDSFETTTNDTVPEPGALALALPGLMPLGMMLRRRMVKKA